MLEVELADALIRILDIAGGLNLDLAGAFFEKMDFNATRNRESGRRKNVFRVSIQQETSLSLLQSDRTALFLDGASLFSASRKLGFDIDYRMMLKYYTERMNVIRAYYYAAIVDTGDDYTPLKPLTDWLSYNGYNVISKPAKESTDATGIRRIKSDMDIEIAVNMLEMAPRIDHAILFAGDSDFRALIESVQRTGVQVTVVSSLKSTPPVVGDELRRQADYFVELADIAPEFTRRLKT
jgi:uncharacterized LabA/DUF88 family protein